LRRITQQRLQPTGQPPHVDWSNTVARWEHRRRPIGATPSPTGSTIDSRLDQHRCTLEAASATDWSNTAIARNSTGGQLEQPPQPIGLEKHRRPLGAAPAADWSTPLASASSATPPPHLLHHLTAGSQQRWSSSLPVSIPGCEQFGIGDVG
jgi:hypothetical protein